MTAAKELINHAPGRRPPEAPQTALHSAAQRGWDDRLGHTAVQAKNWRYIAFAELGIIAVLAIGLGVAASRPKPSPLVVTTNAADGSWAVHGQMGVTNYQPTPNNMRYFLGNWISLVRSVPLDPVVVKQNWNTAYFFMEPASANKLNAWAREPDSSTAKLGQETVSVQVQNVLPVSANSYEAHWTETTYTNNGALKSTDAWSATFTIDMVPPTNDKLWNVNPLGLYIRDFAWHRDITGSR
jgi:type IV secretion system protein VirB5